MNAFNVWDIVCCCTSIYWSYVDTGLHVVSSFFFFFADTKIEEWKSFDIRLCIGAHDQKTNMTEKEKNKKNPTLHGTELLNSFKIWIIVKFM